MTKTTTIPLEAGLKSSLDWSKEKELALQNKEEGKLILWELQLGLFDQLVHPFSHQSQFLSLRLSLDHFKTDLWPEWQEYSLGVCLYRGSADYRKHFPWDDSQRHNLQEWVKEAFPSMNDLSIEIKTTLTHANEITPKALEKTPEGCRLLSLFCRDACVEYLNLLTANIPDEIPVYVHLDSTGISDPALAAQLTSAEKYERMNRLIEGEKPKENARIAFCIPPSNLVHSSHISGLSQAIQKLDECDVAYKFIPESSLITEWDGLDVLIVCSKGVGPQGVRKFQGFCAAGGQIVTIGLPLGLPEEIDYEKWSFDLPNNS